MVVGMDKRERSETRQNSVLTLETVWKSSQIGVANVVVNAWSECMANTTTMTGLLRRAERDVHFK